jgi:hypothetical protein
MERPEEDQSPKAQILELINRYFAAIEDKCLDFALAESTFAPERKMVRPNGAEILGPAAITEGQNESFAGAGVHVHLHWPGPRVGRGAAPPQI